MDALRAAGRGEAGLRADPARGGDGRVVIGEITLPGVRRSVGFARSFVRDMALDFPGRDDMILVVSEAVANAITHTASGRDGGRLTVVLKAGGGMYRLEVVDDGGADGAPHVKAEVGAETGRGMRIVDALAARWGFRVDGARTVVWAEFPAPVAEDRGREPFSGPG